MSYIKIDKEQLSTLIEDVQTAFTEQEVSLEKLREEWYELETGRQEEYEQSVRLYETKEKERKENIRKLKELKKIQESVDKLGTDDVLLSTDLL